MKTEPNNAMEPIPVSVTVPASAGPAPLTSMAHLRRSAKRRPAMAKLRKLNRQEMIELVTRIVEVVGSEEEQDEMIELFEFNCLNSKKSDLIFYPGERELTVEEIVDAASQDSTIRL